MIKIKIIIIIRIIIIIKIIMIIIIIIVIMMIILIPFFPNSCPQQIRVLIVVKKGSRMSPLGVTARNRWRAKFEWF